MKKAATPPKTITTFWFLPKEMELTSYSFLAQDLSEKLSGKTIVSVKSEQKQMANGANVRLTFTVK